AYSAPERAAGILVRAVALPETERPSFAVVFDVPVGATLKDRLRGETGVGITSVGVLRDTQSDARPLDSRELDAATAAVPSTALLAHTPSPLGSRDQASGNARRVL